MIIERELRLGMVGCGVHSHVHAEAAKDVPGVRLVAGCDIDIAKADGWATRHEAERAYASLEEMLRHPNLDGVILCTWPNLHIEQIEVCFSNGILYVLCEKALVTSAEEAKRALRLVETHGGCLVEASVHRHQPAIQKLEQLIEGNRVGPVDSVRAAFHNFEPEGTPLPSGEVDWRYRPECGGGVTYDWLHYLVDSCNHFNKGRPKRVFATGNVTPRTGLIYRMYGIIEYEGGGVGIIENSKLASFSNALDVTCTDATLHLPIAWAIQGEVTITETRRKPDWDFTDKTSYTIPKTNAYALQLEDFCNAIRGTSLPRVPLADAVINAVTTEALVRSLREGRSIDVKVVAGL